MSVLSVRVDGNPPWNGTWWWNQLQWSSSKLTPPGRTLWISVVMFTSYGGCWGRHAAVRKQKNIFAGTSWTQSNNTFSIGDCLCHQRQDQDRAQLMSLVLTLKLNSVLGTVLLMVGSWPLSETPVKKLWPWQEMPTDGHRWPQHFWKTKLRGWTTLSGTVTDTLEATDAQVAKEDPRLQTIRPKSPRQCYAMGTLLKGGPSHPDLPNQDGR